MKQTLKKMNIQSTNDVLRAWNSLDSAYRQASNIYRSVKRRSEYRVTIPQSTHMYIAVSIMLHDLIVDPRDVTFQGYFNDGRVQADELLSEGAKYSFNIGLYRYGVSVETAKKDYDGDATGNQGIVITCPNRKAVDVLRDRLLAVEETMRARQKNVCTFSKYGWSGTRTIPNRSLDKLVLRTGVLERLVASVDDFYSSRDLYISLGIPWHRGILLSGPPGTGKSSLVVALANHFDKNIYFLSLKDLQTDKDLIDAVQGISGAGILLLEDVDAVSQDGTSIAALLNVLDGSVTPDGLLVVMTTNHPEKLNQTLLRPGRVDTHEYIDVLDDDQLERLVYAITGKHHYDLPPLMEVWSPAEVIGLVKTHIRDLDSLVPELRRQLMTGKDVQTPLELDLGADLTEHEKRERRARRIVEEVTDGVIL